MLRFRIVVVINALLVLAFVASNCIQWADINKYTTTSLLQINWDPSSITLLLRNIYPNGIIIGSGMERIVNFPFMIFFLSLVVNLCFIFLLQRSKETK
jgi:hypothetical protein